MSSSVVTRFDHASSRGEVSRLRGWFDDLPTPDCIIVERLLGHSMSYLSFQVSKGFIDDILSYWIPDCHVFRIGTHELTPTLEEYACIAGLSLTGPYARVSVGYMR